MVAYGQNSRSAGYMARMLGIIRRIGRIMEQRLRLYVLYISLAVEAYSIEATYGKVLVSGACMLKGIPSLGVSAVSCWYFVASSAERYEFLYRMEAHGPADEPKELPEQPKKMPTRGTTSQGTYKSTYCGKVFVFKQNMW